jgi:hypothetical protein
MDFAVAVGAVWVFVVRRRSAYLFSSCLSSNAGANGDELWLCKKTVILSLILHTESTSNACVEHRASSAGDPNMCLHRLCGAVTADRMLRDHGGNKSLGDQTGTVQLPQSAGGFSNHSGDTPCQLPLKC